MKWLRGQRFPRPNGGVEVTRNGEGGKWQARRTVTYPKPFAACRREEQPKYLGRITVAERRLLIQPRSVEVRAPKFLEWGGGQKRERETGEGVSLHNV